MPKLHETQSLINRLYIKIGRLKRTISKNEKAMGIIERGAGSIEKMQAVVDASRNLKDNVVLLSGSLVIKDYEKLVILNKALKNLGISNEGK